MTWQHDLKPNALPRNYFTWQLDRPQPALPSSYFWTVDHSTNWVLDDPGLQDSGCYNRYFKQPETFIEDYRRLTDLAAGLGIRGILVGGFLRDAHGGVEYSKRVVEYAASRGVAAMPIFGTTWYGGAYYEGDHRYNLDTFIAQHPEARMMDQQGQPFKFSDRFGAALGHPAYQAWLREALAWLFTEFGIQGINFENGDFLVDYHPLTQALRKDWPADDPEVFFHQGKSYGLALDAIREHLPTKLCSYATYTGFQYSKELVQNTGLGAKPPAMFSVLPKDAVAQWTLTGMVLEKPLPLTAYLDDGAPDAAFDNPNWPADLRPPNARSTGFVHQGSQWAGSRSQCVVSTIKEACLRAYRSGLEGVSIHGEVSSRCIHYALNYLAFSHFTHWPEDDLREFGRKTLGPVLGSEQDGEIFVEILAHCDAGILSDAQKEEAQPGRHGFGSNPYGSNAENTEDYQRYLFWQWLAERAQGMPSPQIRL